MVSSNNSFLQSLSSADHALLEPHLINIDLAQGAVLFEAGAR